MNPELKAIKEARGRTFKGLVLPRFNPGAGEPSILSASAMNRLVDSVNSLSNMRLARGESDEVIITDANSILQLAPDFPNLSALTASSLAAYWTFQETSGDKIDSVDGLHLSPTYTAGGTTRDLSVPGIQGNALKIDSLGGTHNDVIFATAASTRLGIGSKGFSIFGWFNVGFVSATAVPFIEYFWTSNIRIRWFASTALTADCVDDNGATASNNSSFTTGAWHFYHFFYDSVAQQLGFSLDGAAPTMFGSGLVFAGFSKMFFQMDLGDLFSTGTNITWDETGIVPSKHLKPSQITSIYNGGAGVTWPQIASIV